jgi:hypothetical protein
MVVWWFLKLKKKILDRQKWKVCFFFFLNEDFFILIKKIDGYAKFSEEVLVSRADLDDLKNIKDTL